MRLRPFAALLAALLPLAACSASARPAASDAPAPALGSARGAGASEPAAKSERGPDWDRTPWEGVLKPGGAFESARRSVFRREGESFVARVELGALRFRWRFTPQSGRFLRNLEVEEGVARVAPLGASWLLPGEREAALVNADVRDGRIELEFADGTRETLEALGPGLRIDLEGPPSRGPREISLGGLLPSPGVKRFGALQAAYCDDAGVGWLELAQGGIRYVSARFDPTLSGSSDLQARPPGELGQDGELWFAQIARSFEDTRGRVQPLRERIWVAWSDQLLDVLPAMQRAPSPARALAGQLYVFDLHLPDFARARDLLEELSDQGVRDLQVWMRQWQRDGYDQGYPDQVWPPRAEWGGLAGLRAVRETARAAGYRFGLHHNWSFNGVRVPGASLLRSDGSIATLPDGGVYLKPRVALELVERVEGQFHAELDTQGSFTDTLSAGLPPVDQDADEAGHGRFLPALADLKQLVDRLRALHGPLNGGEGGLGMGNVLWAGIVDAQHGYPGLVSDPARESTMGRFVDLVPDFALRRLRPLSVRLSMGEPSRFLYPLGVPSDTPYRAEERDQWIACATLYGNAGYSWWYERSLAGDVARDWWATAEASRRFNDLAHTVEAIDCVDERDGRYCTLADKLAAGQSLKLGAVRAHLRYSGGLHAWVNLRADTWVLPQDEPGLALEGAPAVLAPWGRLVCAPDFAAGLLIVDGRRVEFSRGPTRCFVDGRGETAHFGGLSCDGALGVERLGAGAWRVQLLSAYRISAAADGTPALISARGAELSREFLGAPADSALALELVALGAGGKRGSAESVELAPHQSLWIPREELDARGARAVEVRLR